MEGFLSLPRSAKAGLAVLLAVALLGWGIVAYSSKRQHEDTKSLRQALATLDSKTETEQTVTAELDGIRERLTLAETDLSTTRDDKVALEDQVNLLEADLGQRDDVVSDLTERLAALQTSDGGADGTDQALGLVGEQGVDVATLRERLTKARTTLSARSATLVQRDRELESTKADHETAMAEIERLNAALVEQGVLRGRLSKTMTTLSGRTATLAQRDRELERTKADYEAATAQIAALETHLVEQGVLRERLSTIMTTLSGRTATLAQRDRELESVKADYEAATARVEALENDLAEQGVLRERLNSVMAKLSGQSAMLAQRDRAFADLNEEHDSKLSKLAMFEDDATKREETDQKLSSIQLKVDRTEEALKKGADALTVNQQEITDSEARLADLKTDFNTIETSIEETEQAFAEREQDLANLGNEISTEEQKLAELVATIDQRKGEIGETEKRLADLNKAKADAEADISELQAEFEQQASALSDQEDAILRADTRLTDLKTQIRMTEEQIAETKTQLNLRTDELNSRQDDVKAIEATLAALEQDRATTATETIELGKTISEQEAVLKDLELAKGDLEATRTELSYQKKILSERQGQIQVADARLDQMQQAGRVGSSSDQTYANIPIAAVSSDNIAVLPVDPIYEPFPVQTPIGVRLSQIHFDLGSAELTSGGLRKAKDAAAWIKTQNVERIRLVGFTDSIGSKADNLSLAKRRATSLLRLFEEQGVDPNRIEIIAKGEVDTREITEDHTSEPLNRCVGIFIGADG